MLPLTNTKQLQKYNFKPNFQTIKVKLRLEWMDCRHVQGRG